MVEIDRRVERVCLPREISAWSRGLDAGLLFPDLLDNKMLSMPLGTCCTSIRVIQSAKKFAAFPFAITRRELAIVNGTIMRCVLERCKVIPLWLVYPLQRPTIQALTPKESVYDLINHSRHSPATLDILNRG